MGLFITFTTALLAGAIAKVKNEQTVQPSLRSPPQADQNVEEWSRFLANIVALKALEQGQVARNEINWIDHIASMPTPTKERVCSTMERLKETVNEYVAEPTMAAAKLLTKTVGDLQKEVEGMKKIAKDVKTAAKTWEKIEKCMNKIKEDRDKKACARGSAMPSPEWLYLTSLSTRQEWLDLSSLPTRKIKEASIKIEKSLDNEAKFDLPNIIQPRIALLEKYLEAAKTNLDKEATWAALTSFRKVVTDAYETTKAIRETGRPPKQAPSVLDWVDLSLPSMTPRELAKRSGGGGTSPQQNG